MKRVQQGFTLIELMIVVAIIGILAAVAIPQYQDYVVKAKLSKVATAVDPVKLAIANFYQENGSYPAAMASGGDWTSIGLSTATTITTNEVQSVAVAANGVIHTQVRNIKTTGIDGLYIDFTPTANTTNISWVAAPATTSPITDTTAINLIAKWK